MKQINIISQFLPAALSRLFTHKKFRDLVVSMESVHVVEDLGGVVS